MKFTTPVSMPVTEAQYNELKPLLDAMGYEVYPWHDVNTICTNYKGIASMAASINAMHSCDYMRTFIPTYHRDLFLALAAMTDEPNGIAGEWWKYNDFDNRHFTPNKIYKAIRPINMTAAFPDDMGVANGFIHGNDSYFTKATVAEIFAHFGVSYDKVQAEQIQPEIEQPTQLMPQGCTFREWQRTFLAGCIIQGIFANPTIESTEKLIVEQVDKLISELDKTK